jgi:hypothetical protein
MESIFAPVNSTLNLTDLTCCNHSIFAHTPPNEWQWFLTFRLPFPSFRRKVKDYLLQLQLVEGIQLGYIETYSPIEKRIHIMAIGFSVKTGKTLKEVCKVKWAERWCLTTRLLPPSIVIKDSYDSKGLEGYAVTKHYRRDVDAESEPYNLRLLNKAGLTKFEREKLK